MAVNLSSRGLLTGTELQTGESGEVGVRGVERVAGMREYERARDGKGKKKDGGRDRQIKGIHCMILNCSFSFGFISSSD